jgi:hypothetical protein
MNFEQLVEQINAMRTINSRGRAKRWTFTLECGRGETYSNSYPNLYAHSTYERGSVLAGRPQRVYVTQWRDWAVARETLAAVRKAVKGFKYDDCGGTTHMPISQLVSHLPDDTDY